MANIKGILIPIGGNEDKGFEEDEIHRLDYIEEGILFHVVQQAGGPDAKIVVIPTASSIPVEVGENYLKAFDKLGCKDVTILDIRTRKQAVSAVALNHVKQAQCVMFSGGDQSKISNYIGGTALHDMLLERYKNDEGFVIAGTSAGAMAMAEEMIAGGSSTKSFVKDAVKMKKGLGLIPQLIIDTHFIQRGRFGRVAEAVAKHPDLLGVGLAEDTGIIIKNGKDCTVIGSGMALVFDPRKLKHNNEKILKPGTPMSLTNMKVHVLANGDRFNIKSSKIKVLPVESPFV
ncbi:MAG: cyanophycinase [Flavobacteriaceae bacterium]|nr:cyanophycinase [Mangrovimonas sp.]MCB0470155.1 cyanophycinase [Flavobacteriaceae bacterium]HRV55181.1 cyanophycinase [Mangrovimonas sp.]